MTENVNSAKPFRRHTGAALGGLILIAVGVIFLLQNMGRMGPNFNWWALFILIPAASSLWAAWLAFVRGGLRFNAAVRGSLGGGIIILTVALLFLTGLDWSVWWPAMVIVPGVAIFINCFAETDNVSLQALAGMNFWVGTAVAALGTTFLLNNLHLISLHALFGDLRWWGLVVLIPGLGAFFNALIALARGSGLTAIVRGLLVAGMALCAVAVVALLGLPWSWLTPIILIAAGVVMLIGFSKH